MRSARVFLSSTFSDFGAEREVVSGTITSELNRTLKPAGLFVEVIDLRWGVTEEAGLDHAAVDVCRTEVARCCSGGSKPAFVLLYGGRAGWRPLPRVIEAAAFETLSRALATSDPDALSCLEDWYTLDENFSSRSYVLTSRRGRIEAAPDLWTNVEARIRRGVAACASLPAGLRSRFDTSITQIEVKSALEFARRGMCTVAAMRRVVRSGTQGLAGSPSENRKSAEPPESADADPFWHDLEKALGEAATTIEVDPGQTDAYHEKFTAWIRDTLWRAAHSLSAPSTLQRTVAPDRVSATVSRRLEETVASWLQTPGGGVRLLYGASGSGKTTIVHRLQESAGNAQLPVCALYMADAESALDNKGFLETVANELSSERYEASLQPAEIAAFLHARLAGSTSEANIVFVDALERVAWRDPSESLAWLPLYPSEGCKILLTTADESIRRVFAELFPGDAVLDLVEMDDEETNNQIGAYLSRLGRRLTGGQQQLLAASTRGVPGRALVNRIAASFGSRLRSDEPVVDVPDDLPRWIAALIGDLAVKQGHGAPLVTEALALICASRKTASERRLFEILTQSESVRDWLKIGFPFVQRTGTLPRTVFSRMIADLEGVVDSSIVDGEPHFLLAHQLLREGLAAVLPTGALQQAHRALARNFEPEGEIQLRPGQASPHWLSEVPFQLIQCGPESGAAIAKLVTDPDFITAKTHVSVLPDTFEEILLLRERGCFDQAVVREYCDFVTLERNALQSATDFRERKAYVVQTLETMLPANPLRAAALQRAAQTGGPLVRPRLTAPKLPGLTRIDSSGWHFLSFAHILNGELALGQLDGSIAILGAEYGEMRRRLPGHPCGERSGSALGGLPLSQDRLLTWGADGEIAISSVSAARDLLRMRTGGTSIQYAAPTPGGGVIASSHGDRCLYRWDSQGQPSGRIEVESGNAPSFTMTESGLRPSQGVRRHFYLPMTSESMNEIAPAFRSSFAVLDDERIAIGGMGTLSVWSFRTLGPEILIDQIYNQDLYPKYVSPVPGGLLIAANSGAVMILHLAEHKLEFLQLGAHLGGADPLDENRLFCWSMQGETVQAVILDRRTGVVAGQYRLRANKADGDMQYFRGGASNVPRGLLQMRGHILGWSGYGCEAIDLERGEVIPLMRWGFEHYTTAAIKVREDEVLLIKSARPVLYNSATGRETIDLTELCGEIHAIRSLGSGHVVAVSDNRKYFYWNLPESKRWIDAQDWIQLGRQPRARVLDARLLPGGHLAVQHRVDDDSNREFEFWEFTPDRIHLVGRAHRVRIIVGQDIRFGMTLSSGFAPLGNLIATWGGPPPAFRIDAATQEGIFSHTFEGGDHIRHFVPLFRDGESAFAVAAIICASERTLHVLLPESGVSWMLPKPDETGIQSVFSVGTGLVVVTEAGLWRAVFAGFLPRDPQYVPVLLASALAAPGYVCELEDVVHSPNSDAGLAVLRIRPDIKDNDDDAAGRRDEPHRFAVAAYHLDRGLVAHEVFADLNEWTACEEGLVLFRSGASPALALTVGGDSGLEMRSITPDHCCRLPRRAANCHVFRRLSSTERDYPLLLPHEGVCFESPIANGRAVFAPSSISVEQAGVRESWIAPDGYVLLDFDNEVQRALVRTGRSTLQVLDLGLRRDGATVVPISLAQYARDVVDFDLTLALRRFGRPDLSLQCALHWLKQAEFSGPHARSDWYANLLLEVGESFLASGAVEQAVNVLAVLQSAMGPVPEEGDGAGELLWERATLFSVQLTMLKNGGAAFPIEFRGDKQAKDEFASMWIAAALSLYRKDPPRIDFLSRWRREIAERFELVGVARQTAAGLEDLDMLIGLMPASDQEEEAVDWNALLGDKHAGLLALANAGDPEAQSAIGALFGRGDGVERNPVRAAHWYQSASDAGSATGAMNLAQMYRHGEGVPKDPARGFAFTKLAAERGMTEAKCNLGMMLLTGGGCETDLAAARHWLQAAHDEGDDLATVALAHLLAQGVGGPRDVEQARSYLRPLANRGNIAAIQSLAMIEA